MDMRYIINLIEDEDILYNLHLRGLSIKEEYEIYNHGQCHILAIALANVTGKPLEAALAWDDHVGKNCLTHAWVRWNDDLVLDVGGLDRPATILMEFPLGDESEIVSIDTKDLMRLGGGRASDISQATPLAKTLAELATAQIENGWTGS